MTFRCTLSDSSVGEESFRLCRGDNLYSNHDNFLGMEIVLATNSTTLNATIFSVTLWPVEPSHPNVNHGNISLNCCYKIKEQDDTVHQEHYCLLYDQIPDPEGKEHTSIHACISK